MNNITESIVILDACVLYPAPVRDILLSLAIIGLFQPKWTDKINEEWVRSLLENYIVQTLEKCRLIQTAKKIKNCC